MIITREAGKKKVVEKGAEKDFSTKPVSVTMFDVICFPWLPGETSLSFSGKSRK
nr:hypothetical protein [Candidatus Sigynarchaeum springense]